MGSSRRYCGAHSFFLSRSSIFEVEKVYPRGNLMSFPFFFHNGVDLSGLDPRKIYDMLQKIYTFVTTLPSKIWGYFLKLPYLLYSSFLGMATTAMNSLANIMTSGITWIGSLFGIATPIAAVVFGIILVFGAYFIIKLILYVI